MTIIHTDTPNQKLIEVLNKYPIESHSQGVDVSKHQGEVNFDTMKKRGVHYAAFRTTIGNYYKDPMRKTYQLNSLANQIHPTDYHVVRPDNSARSQMDNYFSTRPTGGTPPIWPMVLDDEIHGKEIKVKINKKKYKFVWKKFPRSQITDRLLECKEIVEERDGVTPLHYSYLYFLLDHLEDIPEVWEMDQWVAHFGTLKPGWVSGRNKLAALNKGKGIELIIWQCLANGDNQGPYFGSGAHGLDVDLFMLGGDDAFDQRYGIGSPGEPPLPPLSSEIHNKALEEGREALEDLKIL